jgi:hypothetical protein
MLFISQLDEVQLNVEFLDSGDDAIHLTLVPEDFAEIRLGFLFSSMPEKTHGKTAHGILFRRGCT